MYSTKTGLILGFHGTDETIAKRILKENKIEFRKNRYDWLGHGAYFWEHSPDRALDFVEVLKANPRRTKITITKPAVIGAVISLGKCLDFTNYENLKLLKKGHEIVKAALQKEKRDLPINKSVGSSKDLLLRELDCLVIETLHEAIGLNEYDSVRGVFWEGDEVYPTAGFKDKNHIQICIRNPNCIKGFFNPIDKDEKRKLV